MQRIGPHISKESTPNQQRQQARDYDWGVVQTHAGSPQTLRLDTSRISSLSYDGRKDIIWVVHAAYPALFSPPERTWGVNAEYMLKLATWCTKVGADFAVIHLGKTKDLSCSDVVSKARDYWAKQIEIQDFLREQGLKFLIENVAGAYPANQDLNTILDIVRGFDDILGWCLDLAHANAAQVDYGRIIEILLSATDRPTVIHCNYPGSLYGSGLDRHGWLYKDETPVSNEMKDCWKAVVKVAYRAGIPLIAEGSSNPGSVRDEVEAIRNLVTVG